MANLVPILTRLGSSLNQVSKARWTQEIFVADADDAATGQMVNGQPIVVGKAYKIIVCNEDYTNDKGRNWKKGDALLLPVQ